MVYIVEHLGEVTLLVLCVYVTHCSAFQIDSLPTQCVRLFTGNSGKGGWSDICASNEHLIRSQYWYTQSACAPTKTGSHNQVYWQLFEHANFNGGFSLIEPGECIVNIRHFQKTVGSVRKCIHNMFYQSLHCFDVDHHWTKTNLPIHAQPNEPRHHHSIHNRRQEHITHHSDSVESQIKDEKPNQEKHLNLPDGVRQIFNANSRKPERSNGKSKSTSKIREIEHTSPENHRKTSNLNELFKNSKNKHTKTVNNVVVSHNLDSIETVHPTKQTKKTIQTKTSTLKTEKKPIKINTETKLTTPEMTELDELLANSMN